VSDISVDTTAAQAAFCYEIDAIDRRIGQWARNYIHGGKSIRDAKRRLADISALVQLA